MRNIDRAFRKQTTFNIVNPIKNSTSDGVFDMTHTTLDKYKANLYTLLFTGIGERVMLPEFGTRLKYLLFENMTDQVVEAMKTDIVEKVGFWIPELALHSVEFPNLEDDMENNRINIKISFGLKVDPEVRDFIEIDLGV